MSPAPTRRAATADPPRFSMGTSLHHASPLRRRRRSSGEGAPWQHGFYICHGDKMTRSVSPKARLRGAHLSTPAEQNRVLKIPLVPAEGSRLWRQTNLKPGPLLPVQDNHSWLPSRQCFDNAGRGFSVLPAPSPGGSVGDGETRCDFPPLSRRGMAKSVKLVPQPAMRSVCGAAASGNPWQSRVRKIA
jgi:hypothetical protein